MQVPLKQDVKFFILASSRNNCNKQHHIMSHIISYHIIHIYFPAK